MGLEVNVFAGATFPISRSREKWNATPASEPGTCSSTTNSGNRKFAGMTREKEALRQIRQEFGEAGFEADCVEHSSKPLRDSIIATKEIDGKRYKVAIDMRAPHGKGRRDFSADARKIIEEFRKETEKEYHWSNNIVSVSRTGRARAMCKFCRNELLVPGLEHAISSDSVGETVGTYQRSIIELYLLRKLKREECDCTGQMGTPRYTSEK